MTDRLHEELTKAEIQERARKVNDWGAGYELGRRFGLGHDCIEAVARAAKRAGHMVRKTWHAGIKAGSRVRADDPKGRR